MSRDLGVGSEKCARSRRAASSCYISGWMLDHLGLVLVHSRGRAKNLKSFSRPDVPSPAGCLANPRVAMCSTGLDTVQCTPQVRQSFRWLLGRWGLCPVRTALGSSPCRTSILSYEGVAMLLRRLKRRFELGELICLGLLELLEAFPRPCVFLRAAGELYRQCRSLYSRSAGSDSGRARIWDGTNSFPGELITPGSISSVSRSSWRGKFSQA